MRPGAYSLAPLLHASKAAANSHLPVREMDFEQKLIHVLHHLPPSGLPHLVCVCFCVCVCVCVCVSKCVCVYVCACVQACAFVHIYACVLVRVWVRETVSMHKLDTY